MHRSQGQKGAKIGARGRVSSDPRAATGVAGNESDFAPPRVLASSTTSWGAAGRLVWASGGVFASVGGHWEPLISGLGASVS